MDLIVDIYVLIIFISKFCLYDLLFYYTCNIELNNISTNISTLILSFVYILLMISCNFYKFFL